MRCRRTTPPWTAFVFTVLIIGGMTLFFSRYDPWEPIGAERIADGGFEGEAWQTQWTGWNDLVRHTEQRGFRNSAGVVLNTTSGRNGILRRTVRTPADTPAFRASLRAKANGIVRGRLGYHIPRALFYYRDRQGKGMWSVSHGIVNLRKDSGWNMYSNVFPVPDDVMDAHLHIENGGVAGVLYIDDVSLVPVRPRTSAPWWRTAFAVLWMSTFGFWLFRLRPWRKKSGLAATGLTLLILAGIVMPGEALDDAIRSGKSVLSERVMRAPEPHTDERQSAEAEQTPAVSAASASEPETAARTPAREMDQAHETGHRVLFALLGCLAGFCWLEPPRLWYRAVWLTAGLTCFAAATETLQMITPDREAGWSDLLTDLSGAVPAVAAVTLLQWIRRAHRRKRV